ncbi:MAG: hypothetical protein V2J02_17530 [Pseudomonadales bacterium]|jgi:hypothetical protein|nr:hypothetical protein [Pseudomonadales bacterium]
MTGPDDDFEARLRRRLDEELDRVDPEQLARLGAARREAVARLERPRPSFLAGALPRWTLAAAAALLVAVMIAQGPLPGPGAGASPQVVDLLDGREAAAIEELELLEEMEFLAWLEYEAELGNGTDGAG